MRVFSVLNSRQQHVPPQAPEMKGGLQRNVRKFSAKITRRHSYFAKITDIETKVAQGEDISHFYLKGKNLKGANLSGANLRGVDLRGANLQSADLTGADLRGADLRGADLRGANLTGTDLRAADLRAADLRGAYLDRKSLESLIKTRTVDEKRELPLVGINLWNGTLDLSGLDLRYLNLRGANLREASFLKKTNLRGADLRHADLTGAKLWRADLRGANLRHADLTGTELWQADLRGADLRHVDLTGVELLWDEELGELGLGRTVIMQDSLAGATLDKETVESLIKPRKKKAIQYCFEYRILPLRIAKRQLLPLRGVILTGDFSNLNLDLRLDLTGVNLTNAILDNTTINLSLSHMNSVRGLDDGLNHLNNENGSLLTAINSIDNKYKGLKINLMKQVIDYIAKNKRDISLHKVAMLDILMTDPIYMDDSKIRSFIVDKLMPDFIQKANTSKVSFQLGHVLLLVPYVCEKLKSVGLDFYKKNSGMVNQLLLHMKEDVEETAAKRIQAAVRKTPGLKLTIKIVRLNRLISALDSVIPEAVKSVICATTGDDTMEGLFKDSDFVFFPSSDGHYSLVDTLAMQRILRSEADDEDFKKIVFIKKSNAQSNEEELYSVTNGLEGLNKIYANIPLLDGAYKYFLSNFKFNKFIDCLELGEEYDQLLKEATKTARLTDDKKLTGNQRDVVKKRNAISEKLELKLREDDKKYIQSVGSSEPKTKQIEISDAHVNEILRVFDCVEKPAEEQALLLLCLATVFSKYSSSYMFGEGGDSPQMLRNYALALINKSVSIKNNIIDSKIVEGWRVRLSGSNRNAFECTAMLTDSMKIMLTKDLRSNQHKQLAKQWFLKLFPAQW